MEAIELSPEFKLKLKSKKLGSGKLQVKFFSTFLNQKEIYGYLLVESKTTLKEVVEEIYNKLNRIQEDQDYYHSHLYSVGKESKDNFHFRILLPDKYGI